MSADPRVVIGVPLYDQASHLAESLESLLAQTYRSLAFVLIDDGSSDETTRIVQRYLAIDPRISYERNGARLGMIQNWRKAFRVGRARYPRAEYFAWGSDHDLWHPRWVEALVRELDANPAAVLAYPQNVRISGSGAVVKGPWSYEIAGVADAAERLRRSCLDMKAGDMVYALYRAEALERAGVFRPVLLPDRLLLAELSLAGEFKQVPEILWYRRFTGLASTSRQRAAFFPRGAPWHSYLPWYLTHGAVLLWSLAVRGTGPASLSRARGSGLALRYLWYSSRLANSRRANRFKKLIRRSLAAGTRSPARLSVR